MGASRVSRMGGTQECKLLSDVFGIVVQLLLALICFSSLVIKWQLEVPKRAPIVWVLDSSKQGFSSVCAHITGLIVATMVSTSSGSMSECAWYFVVFCVDTTLGVTLAYL